MVQKFRVQRFGVQRFKGSGLRGSGFRGSGFRGSAPPPACKAISQIEKETLKKRISNIEYRISKECILSIL
jgi:hypothetical protein